MKTKLETPIKIKEFAYLLERTLNQPNAKLVFFLGAGCSVTSGIPAGGSLVKEWLTILHDNRGEGASFEEWFEVTYPEGDLKNLAPLYPDVIKDLFKSSKDRQSEIERIMEGHVPGFGYSVIAKIVENYRSVCSTILTTNFDELIADAFYLFTETKPLVIHHHALADYIRSDLQRPTVLKIHGDFQFSPINDEQEQENLDPRLIESMQHLLQDSHLVFMGYGGLDKRLIQALEGVQGLDKNIYWVNDRLPDGEFRAWLEKNHATHVEHLDFDQAMLFMHNRLGLKEFTKKDLERKLDKYNETLNRLKESTSAIEDPKQRKEFEKEYHQLVENLDSPYAVYLAAKEFFDTNLDKADQIFQAGLEKFPNEIVILGNYANFLADQRKDEVKAEEYYLKALDVDPNDVTVLGNYANFLTDQRQDHDKAEAYYLKALEADPNQANVLGNYANFLADQRQDHYRAEAFYLKALEADPKDANVLGNYATFLADQRQDHDKAEAYYVKALEADPKRANTLGNYASFLLGAGKTEPGKEKLGLAFSLLQDKPVDELELECQFYRYAHFPEEADLPRMQELLTKGTRAKDWPLEKHLEQAKEKPHPELGFLKDLKEVVNGVSPLETLNQYPVWTS